MISTTINTGVIDDRIRGAIWGQFVGDAFCLGSHWIYDLKELELRFPGGPEGFETPVGGHYHFGKHTGDLTHYGEGALLQLQSLVDRGGFDAVDFGSRFVALTASPEYHGYRDHAAKGTLVNAQNFHLAHPEGSYSYQDGADDDQLATVSRLAPVAAYHFRESNYLDVVERATRVCQNNNRAVAYAQAHAVVLRAIFSAQSLQDAFQLAAGELAAKGQEGAEVAENIIKAIAVKDQKVTRATLGFGQSCPLASSFPSAVQCALHHAGNFEEAIKAVAAAGGDNAGRAAMVGAWLGGFHGIAAIPVAWRDRLSARDAITANVEQIVKMLH